MVITGLEGYGDFVPDQLFLSRLPETGWLQVQIGKV